MLNKALTAFILLFLFLLGPSGPASADPVGQKQKSPDNQNDATGTLQKMIVESGSATMEIDLNRLTGISSATQSLEQVRFAVAADSFFPILVFNNVLRGPELGSISLVPQNSVSLPAALTASLNQLAIEKMDSGAPFDMVVRDSKSGFVFFNIEGHQYDYDAGAQLFSIQGGRLLVSKEFANALGRPSNAGAVAGKISVGAATQPIEIMQLVNGQPQSVVMPALGGAVAEPAATHGPDVIVGDLPGLQ